MRATTVDLDGPVHLVEHGGTGTPLLLIHGIDGSHVNFDAVAERFAAVTRTLSVDLVGFGYTPPAGRSSDLRTNRRLLLRLLREVIGEPTVLLGTSMGGLLTMAVAGRAPELVAGMVLVGPGQPRPRGVPLSPALALEFVGLSLPVVGPVVARRRFRQAPDLRAEEALARVCADPGRIPPRTREHYHRMIRERAGMPWAATAFRQAARSLVRELRDASGFPDYVRRLHPPCLLVQGVEDQLVSVEASRRLAALRPDWRYVELEGVGHSPQLEVPEQLTELVGGWLAERQLVGAAGRTGPSHS